MSNHRKLTSAELVAELKERFGDDPMAWAFQCPNCGDIATGQDFRDALKAHPRRHRIGNLPVITSEILGQECIGRTLGALRRRAGDHWDGRGCDWSAYGLLCGPWEIVMADGRSAWGFPIADAPARAEVSAP
jgi:hypothetical protein